MTGNDPGRTAMMDQLQAGLRDHMDVLIATHQKIAEERGDTQACADICAMLAGWSPIEVAAVAAVAIKHLALLASIDAS